jgi:hypothetical protein
MSVESILQALAESSGRRELARGQLWGHAVESIANLPTQITAAREHQRIQALQEARQNEQLGYQRAANTRADSDQARQDQAAALEARRAGALKLGIAAGFGDSQDPKDFDEPKAMKAVIEAGFPELATTISEVHQKFLPKLTSGAAGSVMRDEAGHVVPGSEIPVTPKPPEVGTPAYEVYARAQRLQAPTPLAPGEYGPPTPGLPPDQAVAQAYADQRKATAPDLHSPAYKEWKDYQATGGALDFNAYMTADANRKRPVVSVGGMAGMYNQTDPKAIAAGIKDGSMPPDISQYGRPVQGAVATELQKQGFNLAMAQTDWKATQKHVASLNSAQQLRLNQAVGALPDLLDSVDSIASEWKGGKFPILNKANLALAKGGAYGTEVATVANKLDAQIADVTSDLAVVYMGGNSPTDHGLGLAAKSLQGDWDEKVIHNMVKMAKANVIIRKNSISNTGVAGASATNPYAPPTGGIPPPAADTAGPKGDPLGLFGPKKP